MKILFFLLIGLTLFGCGKDKKDSQSKGNFLTNESQNEINFTQYNYFTGEYVAIFEGETDDGRTKTTAFGLKLTSDKNVEAFKLVVFEDDPTKFYYQTNEGTFSNEGNIYTFKYDYETCDPVGTEEVTINSDNPSESITISSGEIEIEFYKFENESDSVDNSQIELIEDTECVY